MKFTPPQARASQWGLPDGTQTPVIRVNCGKALIVVDYADVPKLIADLATLLHTHQREEVNHGAAAHETRSR